MWPDLGTVCFSEAVVLNIEPTWYWTQLLTGWLNLNISYVPYGQVFFPFGNIKG